jgi:hypothetical protein
MQYNDDARAIRQTTQQSRTVENKTTTRRKKKHPRKEMGSSVEIGKAMERLRV